MATPFKRLGDFLNRPLTLSPTQRSILAQKLLEQSSQSPQGIVSPYGVANKALQGLLARRQNIAEKQQQELTSDRQQALAGALSRSTQADPYKSEAARRAAMIISGGLPEDPLAQQIMQAQASQIFGGADPTRENVQSTFIGDNGNLFTVRRDGRVIDTGQKVSDSLQVRETPGGGLLGIETRGGGTVQIRSPEAGTAEAATRVGAERTAAEQAQIDTRLRQELPLEVSRLSDEIERNELMLKKIEAGEVETGPAVGLLPSVTTAQQEFDVFSGEDVISKISSATFGQLSEGEREFLFRTVPSRSKTEEANKAIIQRRINILRRQQERMKERLEDLGVQTEPRQQTPTAVPNIDLSQLSDEELRRLAGGQ